MLLPSPYVLAEVGIGPSRPLPRRAPSLPRAPTLPRISELEPDADYASDDSSCTIRPKTSRGPKGRTQPLPPCPAPADRCVTCAEADLRAAVQLDCSQPGSSASAPWPTAEHLTRLDDTLMHYATLRIDLSQGSLPDNFVHRAEAARGQVLMWEQRRALQQLHQALPALSQAIEAALLATVEPSMAALVAQPVCERLATRIDRTFGIVSLSLTETFDLECWVNEAIRRALRHAPASGHDGVPCMDEVAALFDGARRAAQLRHLFELVHDIDMRALSERLADN